MHKEENFFYVNTMPIPNQYVTVHHIKVSFKVRFYLFAFLIIVFSLIFFMHIVYRE